MGTHPLYFWGPLIAFAALQGGLIWGGYLAHRRIDKLKAENLEKDKTIEDLTKKVEHLESVNPFRWTRRTAN